MLAESCFRLHSILREQTRYDYLVSALTKKAISLILDIVGHPPERLPYSALKQSLLDSHQLSDYQRIAALHKMEPLGSRKPSELLDYMLELCPRGHETSIFFTYLILERLPAEIRIMLGKDDHQNVRAQARRLMLCGHYTGSRPASRPQWPLWWMLTSPPRWRLYPLMGQTAVEGVPARGVSVDKLEL